MRKLTVALLLEVESDSDELLFPIIADALRKMAVIEEQSAGHPPEFVNLDGRCKVKSTHWNESATEDPEDAEASIVRIPAHALKYPRRDV